MKIALPAPPSWPPDAGTEPEPPSYIPARAAVRRFAAIGHDRSGSRRRAAARAQAAWCGHDGGGVADRLSSLHTGQRASRLR